MAETSLTSQSRDGNERKKVDSLDWESSFTDQFGSAARGQQTDIVLDKAFSQVEQPGLVVDGKNG